ncbi:MAG: motility associated factor glycosyltransferase family protein [Sarcina sp.]
MKKIKTLDNFYSYEFIKGKKKYLLGDLKNYQDEINKVVENLEGLKFDSLIIVFGFDTGEYLKKLEANLCKANKILIIEPIKEIFEENEYLNESENKRIIFFREEELSTVVNSFVNIDNFDNLYFSAFGNYEEIFTEEFNKLKEAIDTQYLSILGNIGLFFNSRENFMRNSLSNLKIIENSSTLNNYVDINENVPAIVVSAGPSLDKNIKDMIKNREKIEKTILIATNRTFSVLIKNGFKPDVIISIDPSEHMYEMMKENLNEEIPLVYYEYSNRRLLKEYRGPKIYISNVYSNVLPEMNDFNKLPQGGSVAHSAIGLANLLGCNPIILVGQDFAYTYDKHHSENATFKNVDKFLNKNTHKLVEDVYGNQIKTTHTLDLFRIILEEHIGIYQSIRDIQFVNCSYGAKIEGTNHRELNDILNEDIFNVKKKEIKKSKSIGIKAKEIIENILEYIDKYLIKASQGIEQCEILSKVDERKSLVDIDEEDIDFQRALFIMDIVNDFEHSLENFYLAGYFEKFSYTIKRLNFEMEAKDYEKLTSNMKYQGGCFLNYFREMKKMLEDVKLIVLDEVTNL